MKPRLLLLFALAAFLSNSCKKDDNSEPQVDEPIETILRDNVRVINSTELQYQDEASDLESGILVFENYTPQDSVIEVGSVIVGDDNEGYIRRILEKQVDGTSMTLVTEQATMEDVIESGEFGFDLSFEDFEQVKSFNLNLPDTNIYTNGPLTIDINNANLNLDPDFHMDFKFDGASMKYFEFNTAGSQYTSSADIVVAAGQSFTLLDKVDTLSHHTRRDIKWIPTRPIPLPIVIITNLYWLAEYESIVDANVSTTTNISNSGELTLGVKYSDNAWDNVYDFPTTTSGELTDFSGTINASLRMNLRPLITVKIYGLAGPELSSALMSETKATIAVPDLNWDFKTQVWMETTAGVKAEIFGESVADFATQVWESERATHRIPDRMEYVSGSPQDGSEGQPLFNPLTVKLVDTFGNPVENVPVFFDADNGNGSVNPESVLTNALGLAQGIWTLGSGAEQNATASSKYGDNELVSDAPIDFTANTGEPISLVGSWQLDSLTSLNDPTQFVPLPGCSEGFFGCVFTETIMSFIDETSCEISSWGEEGPFEYSFINGVFNSPAALEENFECNPTVTLEANYLALYFDCPEYGTFHFTRVE